LVIIAREYIEDRRVRALPKLKVLMLQWEDKENCVASRLSAGTVDEDAWIKDENVTGIRKTRM
jgi:hypothetical protein